MFWADSMESMLAAGSTHTEAPVCCCQTSPTLHPYNPQETLGQCQLSPPPHEPSHSNSLFQLPRNTSHLSGLFCRLHILLKCS